MPFEELLERLLAAFRWNASRLGPPQAPPLDAIEQSWQCWLDDPSLPPPAAELSTTSRLAPRLLRQRLRAAIAQATERDPTFSRRCGELRPRLDSPDLT